MINTVIFDLGGVLVDFNPRNGMKKMNFPDEVIEVFMKNIFSGVWESCDKKNFTFEGIKDYFKTFVKGYEEYVDILWDNIKLVTGVKPYANKLLKDLKSMGAKLYILSNYGNVSFNINKELYDFLPYFDGGVISYEIEVMKPDKQIYEHLINKYNIDRTKALFIDDRLTNVYGALEVGLQALLFDNYDNVYNKLLKLIE